jgi:glucosylceramidase
LVDTHNDRLLLQSSYYYIGHFSRFVRTGARRVLCSSARPQLEAAAFINTDGSTAVVVMNASNTAQYFELVVDGQRWAAELPARAISTYVHLRPLSALRTAWG